MAAMATDNQDKTMKKIFASIGVVFVAAAAFGTSQIKFSPEKPCSLYRLASFQNRQDDVEVKQHLYFRQPDGTVQNYASVRWQQTDFGTYGWLFGLGGAGLRSNNYFQESWDANGNHYIDSDMGFGWPFLVGPDGNGTGDAVYYSHGTAYETDPFEENIWEYSADEHCQVKDSYPPPTTWDDPVLNSYFSYLWDNGQGKETYRRNAQTIWHIQTGGRAIPFLWNQQSVYQFSGYASEIKDIRATPPFDGTYTLPIAPGAIVINGKPLGADHLMYQTLPDDAEYDVTPRVAGNDFYAFTVGASKHTLTSHTWHPALTDPDPSRAQVGVGEEVNVYLDPPLQMTFPETPLWSVSGGTIDPAEGSLTKFTAAYNACIADVTVHVRDVDLRNSFSVVEPQCYDAAHTYITSSNYYGNPPMAGAEMEVMVYFAPLNVSFYKVKIMEVGEDATSIWGWATNPIATYKTNDVRHTSNADVPIPQRLHHRNDTFTPLTEFNCWTGADDNGAWLNPPEPIGTSWVAGGWTWVIPAKWTIDGTQINSMTGWNEVFTVDSSGTFKVQKFGKWVQSTINGVVTTGSDE